MRTLTVALLLAAVLGLTACDSGDDACAGDLGIEEVTVGTGTQAQTTSTVTVNYTGRFESGTVFDEGTAVMFSLDGVIAGFRDGIAGMRVGGERVLTVPGRLAYGEAGRPGIPSCATLIFDIKLLDVN